jgi:hypothetical protein
MGEKEFFVTVERTMMILQNVSIPIDRARRVLLGTQQRTGGTPGETNRI